MDKIEQSFIDGFIKAANFGTNLGELLGGLGKTVSHAPEAAKPAAQQFELPFQQQLGLFDKQPGGIPFNTIPVPTPPTPGMFDKLKGTLNGSSKDLAKATAVGTGAGVGAHYGGQALGTLSGPSEHANILKDPAAASAAWSEMHKPQDPLAVGNLLEQFKQSVIDHPVRYGAGAAGLAGLGGLGYYMHKHPAKKEKPDLSNEPGGPEDLQ